MIKIDKDIPVPEQRRNGEKYPFKHMAVGDSFTLPVEYYNRVNTAMSRWHRGTTWRFTMRNLKTEVRIWRIR
tara:strand:- start:398 stop:613 length:216 start_codon:yes stop_codon:yes gene_type:complete